MAWPKLLIPGSKDGKGMIFLILCSKVKSRKLLNYKKQSGFFVPPCVYSYQETGYMFRLEGVHSLYQIVFLQRTPAM